MDELFHWIQKPNSLIIFYVKTNWPEQCDPIEQLSVINVFKLSIEWPAFVTVHMVRMVRMVRSVMCSYRMCTAIVACTAQNREQYDTTIGKRIHSNAAIRIEHSQKEPFTCMRQWARWQRHIRKLFNLEMNICEFRTHRKRTHIQMMPSMRHNIRSVRVYWCK